MILSLILLAGGVIVGCLLMKGTKTVNPSTKPPAVVAAASKAKTDAVGSKLLSTLVTLTNYGMTHVAGLFENVWTNNKAAIEQGVIVEAEHLAQGGPSLVLADLEAAFTKMLFAKLADANEALAVLNTISSTLGPNHPLLQQFVQGVAAAVKPIPPATP
jgi:hypothetical protein